MDHDRVPVLEALQAFHERGFTPFNPPGHRQGRGVDPRVLNVVQIPDAADSDLKSVRVVAHRQ